VPASNVLDVSRAGLATTNRWNEAGETTLYVAGDVGVAIAEWARHFEVDRSPALAAAAIERTVYRLEITVDRVLDLRDPHVCADLALANAPACFLDITIARATAQFLRRTSPTQAMLVPPIAMLDKPDRWNLVLFLERLPDDVRLFIPSVRPEGPFRWR
jgi:RES domain-containing protein